MKYFKTKSKGASLFTIFLIFTASLFLMGCGENGEDSTTSTTGGDSTTPTTGGETVTAKEFNSSGSLGELFTYTIDTTNFTYSYEIVESDYGLTGTTGSGDIVQNQDGTYSPSDAPDIRLTLLPNTLIVGGADITVGGVETFMLFAGVPALDTGYTPAEIAEIYNYIVFECDDPLDGGVCTSGYRSYYGTFQIVKLNTWQACSQGNLSDENVSCIDGIMTGSWEDEGDGVISIMFGDTEIGKAMLLPSEAGGKVMIIDYKDRQDVGPGILIGVKQQDISVKDLSGKYYFNGDDGGYGDVEVDNVANTYSGAYTEPDGSEQIIRGNLHRNLPWEGWLTSDNYTEANSADDNIVLILPGDGVFLQASRSSTHNDWINVGGKIP